MATGYGSHGIEFQIKNSASSPDYVKVAGVTGISGPGLSMETIDVTSFDSVEQWREHRPGLKDGGEISLDLIFDPVDVTQSASGALATAHGLLRALATSPAVVVECKLVFPDVATTEWTFNAYVTGFETSGGMADALTASATLKVTGKPIIGLA